MKEYNGKQKVNKKKNKNRKQKIGKKNWRMNRETLVRIRAYPSGYTLYPSEWTY